MLTAILKYLNDPHLVRSIQILFGITPLGRKFENHLDGSSNSSYDRINKESNSSGIEKPALFDRSKSCNNIENDDKCTESCNNEFKIKNRFWYYAFVIGTELGDEIFYATFIPFWFWNIDGAVGRRFIMVWSIVMYVGQGMKDLICWPRPPSPPVFRLQNKWSMEYGMPSTHAMVGVSIPFSIFLFTIQRYEYPFIVGLLIAGTWCSLISMSRLYLGMHSVLDVIGGLGLAALLMIPLVPFVDATDHFFLTSRWSPIVLLFGSFCALVFAPKGKSKIWTPTRGDTTMIVSVCVGIHLGAWANYQLGLLSASSTPLPYKITWPTFDSLGLISLRSILGYSCIVVTRAVCKSAGYAVSSLLGVSTTPLDSPSSLRNSVDLVFKYITYALIGFNTLHLLPNTFKLLSIHRPSFYTEI